jgi:outer membrane biosynthesis protein TonB
VCTDGTVCDLKVLKSVGFGCDEETLRVIQLSSGKWKPAKIRGKMIKSKHTIPINFLISE